jgi:serine/threonine-protein kinase HipA
MKNYKKTYHQYNDTEETLLVHEDGMPSYKKCLYCYETVFDNLADFHETCNKKFFGQLETPYLDYSLDDLKNLALQIVTNKMAVTGVQAKLSLSLNRKDKDNAVRKLTLVGLNGHYILKPPSGFYPQLPEVEDVTMHLSEVCGLKTVPHSLVHLKDGTRCYITKRIDRVKNKKVHMEDMCQLTERLTEDKYKGSHEQVAKCLLKYSANPLLDVTNFYEVVLFSFFTGNADMHLKNFSMIETPFGYGFSPSYDLVNTVLVNPNDNEELALTLNGKKRKLNYNDFLSAFEKSGLSKKVLDTTLENFFYCTKEMKKMVMKSFLTDEYKEKYLEVMKSRFSVFF